MMNTIIIIVNDHIKEWRITNTKRTVGEGESYSSHAASFSLYISVDDFLPKCQVIAIVVERLRCDEATDAGCDMSLYKTRTTKTEMRRSRRWRKGGRRQR